MTTTIQATAKRYKLQMLLGTLLLCIGVVLIVVAAPNHADGLMVWGAVISALGLAWYFAARLAAWWNHG